MRSARGRSTRRVAGSSHRHGNCSQLKGEVSDQRKDAAGEARATQITTRTARTGSLRCHPSTSTINSRATAVHDRAALSGRLWADEEPRRFARAAKMPPLMAAVLLTRAISSGAAVAAAKQTPALGSAMFGAVAAGKAAGGYDSIYEASQAMAHLRDEVYVPTPEHKEIYDQLYAEYKLLHDYFGRGENDVMKHLKKIRSEARQIKS